MSALYTTEILRLALGAAMHPRLADPHGSAEARTPVCGSRIVVDAIVDENGRVTRVGMDVHACAMGQAAAGLFAAAVPGRNRRDIIAARAALAQWLSGDMAVPPDWPGIEALVAARAYPARHAAILLPFDAALIAVEAATQSAFPELVEGLSSPLPEEKGSPSTSSGWAGLGAADVDLIA